MTFRPFRAGEFVDLSGVSGTVLQAVSYTHLSSHMIDLSEESLEENIEISSKYLARTAKIDMTLEIELGCTGGEEDEMCIRDSAGVRVKQKRVKCQVSAEMDIIFCLKAKKKGPAGLFTA